MPGAQLQKIKSFRSKEGSQWLLGFDFFPGPRRGCFSSDRNQRDFGFLEEFPVNSQAFQQAQNPLYLYLKSHFVSRRLISVSQHTPLICEWDFGEGYKWVTTWRPESQELLFCIVVPGRKDFEKALRLQPWQDLDIGPAHKNLPTHQQVDSQGLLKDTLPIQNKKHQKLLENVKSDFLKAQLWLETNQDLCKELETRPRLWADGEQSDSDKIWNEKIKNLQDEGTLPPSRSARTLSLALDKLFNERSRQTRKLEKSLQRLKLVEHGDLVPKGSKVGSQTFKNAVPTKEPSGKSKMPGLKIEIVEGCFGYLGRNRAENETLFKAAKDRDFWFHVRGYSGAHLWILRSELKLAKDAKLPSHIADRAAKVALWNSKLKNSRSGAVDFTEKRHLKKLKGEVGMVKILKSEVLFATLEEDFEKTLKWG